MNLATIVVSLFPVLASDSSTKDVEELQIREEAGKVAVSLLEWLTQGKVGKHLAWSRVRREAHLIVLSLLAIRMDRVRYSAM